MTMLQDELQVRDGRQLLHDFNHVYGEDLSAVIPELTLDGNLPLQQHGKLANATTPTLDALAIIRAAQFSTSKSIRTSTIILAIVNTLAGLIVFSWIFYYSLRNRKQLSFVKKLRGGFLYFVSSPDLFPLILSGTIAIQGIIFAVSQSQGLDGFNGGGCASIAHYLLPVPTTYFVFACEVFIRALDSRPFQPRRRLALPVCLLSIGVLSGIATGLTHVVRADDHCFKSLMWYLSDYSTGVFVVLLIYIVSIFGITVFLFWKLQRTSDVMPEERVSASNMIYFLVSALMFLALLIPFFFVMGFKNPQAGERDPVRAMELGMIASIVACLSGLITGLLHLFLISGNHPELDDGEHRIGTTPPRKPFHDAESLQPTTRLAEKVKEDVNITSPVSVPSPTIIHTTTGSTRSNAVVLPKVETLSTKPKPSSPFPKSPMQHLPPPAFQMKSPGRDVRRYSLFPEPVSKPPVAWQPSAAYNPTLKSIIKDIPQVGSGSHPPPPKHGHRRDSSQATIQIGLRLSNVEDMNKLPSTVYKDDRNIHSINIAQSNMENLPRIGPPSAPKSPLSFRFSDTSSLFEGDTASPEEGEELAIPFAICDRDSKQASEKVTMMLVRTTNKTRRSPKLQKHSSSSPSRLAPSRPASPRYSIEAKPWYFNMAPPLIPEGSNNSATSTLHADGDDVFQLSPAVYTPPTSNSKLPSPKGVGYMQSPTKRGKKK